MNSQIFNICTKRAEKNKCLVYFGQISLQKIKKMSKLKFLEKKLKLFLKKTQAFLASKLNEPVVSHYTPLP